MPTPPAPTPPVPPVADGMLIVHSIHGINSYSFDSMPKGWNHDPCFVIISRDFGRIMTPTCNVLVLEVRVNSDEYGKLFDEYRDQLTAQHSWHDVDNEKLDIDCRYCREIAQARMELGSDD